MLLKAKRCLTHNLLNLPGSRIDGRIVVIESDDWGAIRMRSREAYDRLLAHGYPVDRNGYERNDALASEEDLELLFDLLASHRDGEGRLAAITANCIMTNPDFGKIREEDFRTYHYEPFTSTLARYERHGGSFARWQQVMRAGIFRPQYHGREHIAVGPWMRALQRGDAEVREAFDLEMAGTASRRNGRNSYVVAFEGDPGEEARLAEAAADGLRMFEQLFGYRSRTFIAPCYTWPASLEKTLRAEGVEALQGMIHQCLPGGGHRRHWFGSRNALGQTYLLRNCFFEPTTDACADPVDACMERIACAFRWHKPAVISSHRVNYVGFIHPTNRDRSLRLLGELLDRIRRRWPDVRFRTSDELTSLLADQKNPT